MTATAIDIMARHMAWDVEFTLKDGKRLILGGGASYAPVQEIHLVGYEYQPGFLTHDTYGKIVGVCEVPGAAAQEVVDTIDDDGDQDKIDALGRRVIERYLAETGVTL